MPKAGMFAGEVTPLAPADDAPTTKQKGYVWMEYGRFIPGNCNEIWEIGTLVPDLHVGGVVGGIWDNDVIVGTGVCVDDSLDDVYTTNDILDYTRQFSPAVKQVFFPDCQWYNYSGPVMNNHIPANNWDVSSANWNSILTPILTANLPSIDGTANGASSCEDDNVAGAEGVWKWTTLNSVVGNSLPMTGVYSIPKQTGISNYAKLELAYSKTPFPKIEIIFNAETGSATLGSGTTGNNPAFEVRDNGDWWEVYLQVNAHSSGVGEGQAVLYPSWNTDGTSVVDVSAIGTIGLGVAAMFRETTISEVRGGALEPAGLISSAIDQSNVHIDAANHDDTEGGYYIEWRPLYSHSEISYDIEILSLNDATGLLYYDYSTQLLTATDGTNTATVPLALVKETKYRLGVVFGSSQLRVGVDTEWGTEVAYDGTFAGGSDFTICRNPLNVNYWRELRGFQVTYAEAFAEISNLMSGDPGYVGPWQYSSLSEAESSGDPWVDGDDVKVLGGALFQYRSDLAVSGYSGLIHKKPYGSSYTEISTVTVENSEAANTDPDAWTDWTDGSVGTKGVDYEFDTNAGLARFRDLTIAGQAIINSDNYAVIGNEEIFQIVDDISGSTTATADTTGLLQVAMRAYIDVTNHAYIRLDGVRDGLDTDWRVNHTDANTFATTGKDKSTVSRVWLYLKDGRWACWFDDDIVPAVTGTVPRNVGYSGTDPISTLVAGNTNASTGVSTLTMGTVITGSMETV